MVILMVLGCGEDGGAGSGDRWLTFDPGQIERTLTAGSDWGDLAVVVVANTTDFPFQVTRSVYETPGDTLDATFEPPEAIVLLLPGESVEMGINANIAEDPGTYQGSAILNLWLCEEDAETVDITRECTTLAAYTEGVPDAEQGYRVSLVLE
jgi:hypothetical protein